MMAPPTGRVLALLELLQGAPGATAAELAGRLSVDERTVRRYASHLSGLGIPVQARRGRYGGYRLAPGYRLPPLMLTDDEAVAVVLGLAGDAAAGADGAAGAATATGRDEAARAGTATALTKIRRVLPPAVAARVETQLATLDVARPAPPVPGPRTPTSTVLTLADAARDGQRVSLRYPSGERQVDPYGLVFHAGRWYLAGHDHWRGEVRTFRVDGIEAVNPVAATFTVPEGFDPVAQVARSLAQPPSEPPVGAVPETRAAPPGAREVEVILHTTLAEARRGLPPGAGELTGTADGVRLLARVERLDAAARLLAGLGWTFEIRRPDELRHELLALAHRLTTCATPPAAAAGPGAHPGDG